MKKFIAVMVLVAVAAAAVTALGVAATSDSGPASSVAQNAKLPALPSNIKQRKRFLIGVKCDAPPFGYINVRGENAGFDVEIARWFSRFAFGRENRVNFVCTPTPAREPSLTTGRVDMVIATFTYTRDRDTRIDFSRARQERLADHQPGQPRRPHGRHDEWLDLRPLGPEVLHEHEPDRDGQLHERRDRVQPGPCRHADVGRHRPRRDRGRRPEHEVDERLVPRASVWNRDQAGEHGARSVGELPARADAEEGSVHDDPPQQRPGALRSCVLEEHPAPEGQLRVRARDGPCGGDGLPIVKTREVERPRRAAAPLPR
jgi:hypothetical protein